jgi:hypothetical protein
MIARMKPTEFATIDLPNLGAVAAVDECHRKKREEQSCDRAENKRGEKSAKSLRHGGHCAILRG